MSVAVTKCGSFFFDFRILILRTGSVLITPCLSRNLKKLLRQAIFLLIERGSTPASDSEMIQERMIGYEAFSGTSSKVILTKSENCARSVLYARTVCSLYLFS